MPIIQTTQNLKIEKPEAAHNAWAAAYWRLATLTDLWLTQLAKGHHVRSGGTLSLNGSNVDLEATTVAFAGQAATYPIGATTPIVGLVSGNTYVVYVDDAGALQVSTLDASALWSGALPAEFVLLGVVYEVEGAWTLHNLPLTTGRAQANAVAALDGSGDVPDSQIPAGIQRTSEKGAAGGYAQLQDDGTVPIDERPLWGNQVKNPTGRYGLQGWSVDAGAILPTTQEVPPGGWEFTWAQPATPKPLAMEQVLTNVNVGYSLSAQVGWYAAAWGGDGIVLSVVWRDGSGTEIHRANSPLFDPDVFYKVYSISDVAPVGAVSALIRLHSADGGSGITGAGYCHATRFKVESSVYPTPFESATDLMVGEAGGIASLDDNSQIPDAQIPATIARDTEVAAAQGAAQDYADAQDVTYLTAAKGYADAQDAANLTAAEGYADGKDADHVAAADPHPQYVRNADKDQPTGVPSLNADGKVPPSEVGGANVPFEFPASGGDGPAGNAMVQRVAANILAWVANILSNGAQGDTGASSWRWFFSPVADLFAIDRAAPGGGFVRALTLDGPTGVITTPVVGRAALAVLTQDDSASVPTGGGTKEFTLTGSRYAWWTLTTDTGQLMKVHASPQGGPASCVGVRNEDAADAYVYLQSNYPTGSKPYDIGDGDIPLFVWALVDKAGTIHHISVAEDPPWAYNGPTPISPGPHGRVFDVKPVLGSDGKTVITPGRRMLWIPKHGPHDLDALGPDADLSYERSGWWEAVELTTARKNEDMGLIPHPFLTDDLARFTPVLLDPMSPIMERLLWHHRNRPDGRYTHARTGRKVRGDLTALALLEHGYVRIDNGALKRKAPPGVTVAAPCWRNTGRA